MIKLATILTALLLGTTTAQAADRPVVLELFTSQGCDSCPPAEAFLTELAADPTLLPLSYHVDYWDSIGWKDAFSLKASTDRQYWYAALAGKKSVFTPQMLIDGRKSVIGSRKEEVTGAVAAARQNLTALSLTLAPRNGKLLLHLAMAEKPLPVPAKLIAIRFTRRATTQVKAGENKGRTLTSVNNVTAIEELGTWTQKAQDIALAPNANAEAGIAVLLQQTDGRILGAATYMGM